MIHFLGVGKVEGTKSRENFGWKYFSRGKSEGTILMRPKIELIVYIFKYESITINSIFGRIKIVLSDFPREKYFPPKFVPLFVPSTFPLPPKMNQNFRTPIYSSCHPPITFHLNSHPKNTTHSHIRPLLRPFFASRSDRKSVV